MFGKDKSKYKRCAICGAGLDEGCGLKYRLKVKRYSPEGWFCAMPENGAVCWGCLKTIKQMVLDYKNYGTMIEEMKVKGA